MLKEFREFIMRGNVLDLAVGIIIGTAFGGIVTSLVSDVIMPPIGLILGGVDFSNIFILLREGDPAGPYKALADAQAAGAVTINVGLFVNTVINFMIVALAIFLLIRSVNEVTRRMQRQKQAEAAASAEPDVQEKLVATLDRLATVLEKKD